MTSALLSKLSPLDAAQRLVAFREAVEGRLIFTTSLGLEDQVITHWIATHKLDIQIATLDTGRLFQDTYDVWAKTEERYGITIQSVMPERLALEPFVAAQGPNGFYKGIVERKACCEVRKIVPLKRLLHGAEGWVAGLRADQSTSRAGAQLVSMDTAFNILKLNPLIDWSRAQVLAYALEHSIPLNALHAKGFASIGCAPCSRAIQPGEPERAGRWWWETEAVSGKECGLHIGADGSVSRPQKNESTIL